MLLLHGKPLEKWTKKQLVNHAKSHNLKNYSKLKRESLFIKLCELEKSRGKGGCTGAHPDKIDFDNLIVKLIDLDSICFFALAPSDSRPTRADSSPPFKEGTMASYLPPYTWPPSKQSWFHCNQVTNIWNMAMFALLDLCPTKEVYEEVANTLWARAYKLCEDHFNAKLTDLFKMARTIIEDSQPDSQLNLTHLLECFAPNPCHADDWRRCEALKTCKSPNHDPPFSFAQMFSLN